MRSSLKLPGTTQTDIRFNDQTDQTTALGFCGSFENRADSEPSTKNTVNKVTFDNPIVNDKGITLVGDSKITFTTPGSYFMTSQFNFRNATTPTAIGFYSNVFYNLNSTQVLASSTMNAYPDNQTYGVLQDIVTVDSSGSFIEFYWQPSEGATILDYTPPSTDVPQKPSAKVSVYKIA
jgi:hypothetical protein